MGFYTVQQSLVPSAFYHTWSAAPPALRAFQLLARSIDSDPAGFSCSASLAVAVQRGVPLTEIVSATVCQPAYSKCDFPVARSFHTYV